MLRTILLSPKSHSSYVALAISIIGTNPKNNSYSDQLDSVLDSLLSDLSTSRTAILDPGVADVQEGIDPPRPIHHLHNSDIPSAEFESVDLLKAEIACRLYGRDSTHVQLASFHLKKFYLK